MAVWDVVIHTNAGVFGNEGLAERLTPVQERTQFSDELWVERLDGDMAKLIMDTCEPRVFGADEPWRQYAQLYAFVRELPSNSEIWFWDTDRHLGATVALSRLIHPTSVGFGYAARISHANGKIGEIFPAQVRGVSREAFLSPNRERDWITPSEAAKIGELIPLSFPAMPRRVHSAFWHHEYAAHTYYLDHRWTLVVSGLEALVHTDRTRNTAQFVCRIPQLASDLGLSISQHQCNDAYDLRSTLAHGVSFISSGGTTPTAAQMEIYDRMEDILAAAVLRGLRDNNFASILEQPDRIRAQWPI